MAFDLFNWYWLHDDGRLYSSKRNIIIAAADVEADAEYVSWMNDFPYQGHWRQIWPRETNGVQTVAALQWAINPLGITVPTG